MTDYKALVAEAREWADGCADGGLKGNKREMDMANMLTLLADAIEDAQGRLREVAEVCASDWVNLANSTDPFLAKNYNLAVKTEDVMDAVNGDKPVVTPIFFDAYNDALKALGESRANVADLEARLVEAEARIRAMGDATDIRHGSKLDRLDRIAMLYATAPSAVLADHDAAVWDRALDHVWQLNDPAYMFIADTTSVAPILNRRDIDQARAENPYRGDNR